MILRQNKHKMNIKWILRDIVWPTDIKYNMAIIALHAQINKEVIAMRQTEKIL